MILKDQDPFWKECKMCLEKAVYIIVYIYIYVYALFTDFVSANPFRKKCRLHGSTRYIGPK